jgi:hypothetical protein
MQVREITFAGFIYPFAPAKASQLPQAVCSNYASQDALGNTSKAQLHAAFTGR